MRPTSSAGSTLLPEAAGEADRDDDPERLQQADRVGEQLPADRVEDDVDRRDLAEPVVGDGLRGSEREGKLELVLRACGRDDLGAEVAGDDDGRAPDPTRGGVDEHA